jgi:hypothetical protein
VAACFGLIMYTCVICIVCACSRSNNESDTAKEKAKKVLTNSSAYEDSNKNDDAELPQDHHAHTFVINQSSDEIVANPKM